MPNALLMFKSGMNTGDYRDEMNHKNYMKWLTEKVIPNLQSESLFILDNASYHKCSNSV